MKSKVLKVILQNHLAFLGENKLLLTIIIRFWNMLMEFFSFTTLDALFFSITIAVYYQAAIQRSWVLLRKKDCWKYIKASKHLYKPVSRQEECLQIGKIKTHCIKPFLAFIRSFNWLHLPRKDNGLIQCLFPSAMVSANHQTEKPGVWNHLQRNHLPVEIPISRGLPRCQGCVQPI